MNAVYLSGTGNTKHVTELLFKELGSNGALVPIESSGVDEALEDDELITAFYDKIIENYKASHAV